MLIFAGSAMKILLISLYILFLYLFRLQFLSALLNWAAPQRDKKSSQ